MALDQAVRSRRSPAVAAPLPMSSTSSPARAPCCSWSATGRDVAPVRRGAAHPAAGRPRGSTAGAATRGGPGTASRSPCTTRAPTWTRSARSPGSSRAEVVAAPHRDAVAGRIRGFRTGLRLPDRRRPRLQVPRRAEPRTSVPPGSVALAGGYSAVYPRASPGGWQLIGHTDVTVWDVDREPPALLRPGRGRPLRRRRCRATAEPVTTPVPWPATAPRAGAVMRAPRRWRCWPPARSRSPGPRPARALAPWVSAVRGRPTGPRSVSAHGCWPRTPPPPRSR